MNAGLQTEFLDRMFRPTTEDPRLDELLRLLNERGWLTARQIKDALEFDDRTTRSLAQASKGQILSGQKGYKLTRQASSEERDHAIAWFKSQAGKMLKRAGQISRVHHRHGQAV